MKKGRIILFMILALSFGLVLGVFIGRKTVDDTVTLSAETTLNTATPSAEPVDSRLDINTASSVQLMELPGIGEILAERIVNYRDSNGAFGSVDELMNVEGIGEKKLSQIEHLIKAGG